MMTLPEAIQTRMFMHRVVHVILTWVMLWLSYVFLDHTDTFSTSPSFASMARVMSEWDWGMLTGAVCLVGVITAFVNGWRGRMVGAGVLSVGHFYVAMEIYLGNPNGTGTGPYTGYAILGAALAYSTAHLGRRLEADLASADPPR